MKAFWLRLLILAVAATGVFSMNAEAGEKRPLVLVTTFPLYQIARNVTYERDGFDLELLLAPDAGCPHGYALTPGEMAKLARTDALIINGLGMEDFLAAALESAVGGIAVIDTSKSVDKSLCLPAEEGGYNPHLYASPLARVEIAAGLAEYFAEIDPDGAVSYRKAAKLYGDFALLQTINIAKRTAEFPNRRVIVSRGEAEYFVRDIGLETVGHVEGHDAGLSAAELLELKRVVAEKDPGAIVLEAEYPVDAAGMLLAETGLSVVLLIPVATGEMDATPGAFFEAMGDDLSMLARVLGKE